MFRRRAKEPPEGAPVGTRYRDGIPVANISKRWFRVRDTYGVAVTPGQDDALVLAVTVCIDHLTSHDR